MNGGSFYIDVGAINLAVENPKANITPDECRKIVSAIENGKATFLRVSVYQSPDQLNTTKSLHLNWFGRSGVDHSYISSEVVISLLNGTQNLHFSFEVTEQALSVILRVA